MCGPWNYWSAHAPSALILTFFPQSPSASLLLHSSGAAGSRSDPVNLDPYAHGHSRWAAEVLAALGLAGAPSSAAAATEEAAPLDASSGTGAGSSSSGATPTGRPPLQMGVSLGGAVLLDVMATHPEMVGGAVLVVPGSLHPGRWRSGQQRVRFARTRCAAGGAYTACRLHGCDGWCVCRHAPPRRLPARPSRKIFPAPLLPAAEAGHNWLPLRASLAMLLHWVLRRDWSGALVARLMMAEMCDEPDSPDPAMQAVRLAFRCAWVLGWSSVWWAGRQACLLPPNASAGQTPSLLPCPCSSDALSCITHAHMRTCLCLPHSARHVRFFPEPPRTATITDEALRACKAPVLLIAAEHDVFGPGRGTIERARRVWPDSQCQAVLLEGHKHMPSSTATIDVNATICEWAAANRVGRAE